MNDIFQEYIKQQKDIIQELRTELLFAEVEIEELKEENK